MAENQNQILLENQDFILFGGEDLNGIANPLLSYLIEKKQELLAFFKFSSFPQVQIRLFHNRDDYYDYLDLYGSIENTIILAYNGVIKEQLILFLKRSILHKYVSLLYSKICKNHFIKPFWIEEGLAQIFSGEKEMEEKSEFAFRTFYFDKIVRRDKKVPDQTFFQTQSRFVVSKNNEYDCYDISYLLVHYLMEINPELYPIITNSKQIHDLEKTILMECIIYYNNKYPVKTNFYAIKNDRELMDYFNKNIVYGWLDKHKQEHVDTLKGFYENYRISSIDEILNTGLGTCIEQAKLIKYWFDLEGIENKMFCCRSFSDENRKEEIKMHCFVLFRYGEFWYHFEHSALRRRGIHKFDSLEEAIKQTSKKFLNQFSLNELTEIPEVPEDLTYDKFNQYVDCFDKYELERKR